MLWATRKEKSILVKVQILVWVALFLIKKNLTLVQQITIDNLNLKNISLVKIDVQGYVYQSSAGMKKLISLEKPNLAIEIDSISNRN